MDSTSTTPTPRDVAAANGRAGAAVADDAHLVPADHVEDILDVVGPYAHRQSRPTVTVKLADLPRDRQRAVFTELAARKDVQIHLPVSGGAMVTLGFTRMAQVLVTFAVNAVAHRETVPSTRVDWAIDEDLLS